MTTNQIPPDALKRIRKLSAKAIFALSLLAREMIEIHNAT